MSKPEVKLFFHKDSNTASYVVHDPATKDAVIIDSVMDLDTMNWQVSLTSANEIVKYVEEAHLNVKMVMDTHTHADHITGAAYLRDKFGVPYGIGEKITVVQQTFSQMFGLNDFPCDGSQFDRLFKGDEVIEAGSLRIRCLETNGHTPNCLSYIIGDAVFTGDALFMEDFGTGRCDFPGGSAAELFDSIQRLYSLPHEMRVFVGHDYMPGGRELKTESTIGIEREKNEDITCRATKSEFVEGKTQWDKTLSFPRLIFPSLIANINGGRLPAPAANGTRYLLIPLNLKCPTDDIGRPLAH